MFQAVANEKQPVGDPDHSIESTSSAPPTGTKTISSYRSAIASLTGCGRDHCPSVRKLETAGHSPSCSMGSENISIGSDPCSHGARQKSVASPLPKAIVQPTQSCSLMFMIPFHVEDAEGCTSTVHRVSPLQYLWSIQVLHKHAGSFMSCHPKRNMLAEHTSADRWRPSPPSCIGEQNVLQST